MTRWYENASFGTLIKIKTDLKYKTVFFKRQTHHVLVSTCFLTALLFLSVEPDVLLSLTIALALIVLVVFRGLICFLETNDILRQGKLFCCPDFRQHLQQLKKTGFGTLVHPRARYMDKYRMLRGLEFVQVLVFISAFGALRDSTVATICVVVWTLLEGLVAIISRQMWRIQLNTELLRQRSLQSVTN